MNEPHHIDSQFDKSLITRRNNLEDNDGLSGYNYQACQQTENAFEVFFDFLKDVKPSNIIEIGTALGGFTILLKQFIDQLQLNCNLLTYDIISYNWYDDLRAKGIDVRVENIFTENYEVNDPYVQEYIQRPGRTIVLCDGGSKKDEFRALSSFLKPGDYILAHDYAYNREVFEASINRKIWNWCEITQEDVESSCLLHNLLPYKEDIFNRVAWTCRKKQ
jgi:hypothetical protein